MYSSKVRRAALAGLSAGETVSSVSRRLGLSRSTVRLWRTEGPDATRSECAQCDHAPLDASAYAALLGFYLGDGAISKAPGYYALRVSCDAKYPAIIADVQELVHRVRPNGRIWLVHAPGVIVVQSNWVHWPCLFPQHGPGRKHERRISLARWQANHVRADPAAFLRGLFHSDGARVANWARSRAGKRYDYPRWQFSNRSEDIHGLCQWALDLSGIPWKRSSRWATSVSTKPAVARLDALVDLKS